MNTRTGQFAEVMENPLEGLELDREDWLCYPVQVGPLVVFVYFHRRFIGLGWPSPTCSSWRDEEIEAGPDAIYLFGAPPEVCPITGNCPRCSTMTRRTISWWRPFRRKSVSATSAISRR